ncbi:MAG: leucyl aminopeptidase [Actinomycetota bacterium]|nr:leucyl aminopeptidase [Actinomycetota bacterium]
MTIAFSFSDDPPDDASVVGVPVFTGRTVPDGMSVPLDLAYLAKRGFEGKLGETAPVPTSGDGPVVLAVGVGPREKVDAEVLRRAAAAFVRAAWQDARAASTLLAAAPPGLDRAQAAQAAAEGATLAAYRFSRYKAEAKACKMESLTFIGPSSPEARSGLDRGARLADAVTLARDLVNEPAGSLTPQRLADVAAEIAEREGLALTVLDEVAITGERLGGLLGVAAGSEQPPRLIELVYDPPDARATVALVGKGITFDSGGLSIKTAEGMETMKTDMSGAAAVLAAMSTLPAVEPGVKVIAIIPATENMPGGSATKPGDVLRIRNGKTVEVLNTDAEGRLVLADGLSLAVEAGVDAILDLATLTGACVVALGRRIAGLMGNHEGWVEQVREAAQRAGESVWPLPLPDEYRKQIDSDVADIKNVGGGRHAGALTAGLFLKEFVGDVPWAHLDIAGPARSEEEDAYVTKGGTGFGVRTVVEALVGFQKPGGSAASR